MSNASEVLTPILLRSSTPAPSEKGIVTIYQPRPKHASDCTAPVLLYLEGIQRSGGASPVRDSVMTESGMSEGADLNDPRLLRRSTYGRGSSKARSSGLSRHAYNVEEGELQKLAESEMSYEMMDNPDVKSDIQEGRQSEMAQSIRTPSVHPGPVDREIPQREPGPEDGPGPKYESYGSSFGNLGPPRDSFFGPSPNQVYTPITPPAWAPTDQPPPREATTDQEQEYGSPFRAPWGQHILRNTGRLEAIAALEAADVQIDVEPPTDSHNSSVQPHSRAPTQSYQPSVNPQQPSMSPPPQSPPSQGFGGITVNIGPDGSTTINIPRGPMSDQQAPTERAMSEVHEDILRSPGAQSQRPIGSVVGQRRPSGDAGRSGILSPGTQSRGLKSPEMAARSVISKAPSRGPSRGGMSPVDAYRPTTDYQSFAMPGPPEPPAMSMPQSQRAPSQGPQSSRAPSQRLPPTHREQSELGTIPNEYTGQEVYRDENSYAFVPRGTSTRGPSQYGWEKESESGSYTHEPTTAYTTTTPAPAQRRMPPTASGTSQAGASQNISSSYERSHRRVPSDEPRMSRHKTPIQTPMQALSPVPSAPHTLRTQAEDPLFTPSQTRPDTPDDLNDYETEIVQGILNARTPRTSIAPSVLAADVKRSNYHDEDLCVLLHAADDEMQHEVVRKALRKAVAARIKKLGLKNDKDSIRQYRKQFHDHDPSWHIANGPSFNPDDPPQWAKDMMEQLASMEGRVAALGPQLERLKKSDGSKTRSRTQSYQYNGRSTTGPETRAETIPESHDDDIDRTPRTQTIPIGTQITGAGDSMYRHPDSEYTGLGESMATSRRRNGASGRGVRDIDEFEDADTQGPSGQGRAYTERTDRTERAAQEVEYQQPIQYKRRAELLSSSGRGESPGQQVLEEELYQLRAKEGRPQAHQSWVLHEDTNTLPQAESEIPDIEEEIIQPPASPPMAPLPTERAPMPEAHHAQAEPQPWRASEAYHEHHITPPWQRIHQRLLNWAIVWPMSELDNAISSTARGNQVDEVALSIWATQMYKRYVRQQLTEVPPGRVDRLFVPPNMADAINNAVFHGRHGDACGMLRDLWTPFGLEGMPRIIVVLCKHRSDSNHWVAHKFSLPDGTLTTYDTYPEKCLPDGRPLGWWFAIRIAWPGAMYPSPDHLMQKMVRLHRPMQLSVDNSVAAGGIWRNLLMGSRAERPVDLERIRDLINTEVKNLRSRKEQGKLSVSAATRQNWNWDGIDS